MVLPETIFGIFSALAAPLTTNKDPKVLEVFQRVPYVVLWNWLNVFLFNIANQRLPDSIIEDKANKAWRPIPAGRMTPTAARRLLLATVPAVFVGSLYIGGTLETVVLMVLTWMYNDLGGADELYFVRNIINALGLMCYSSGSMDVAAGSHSLTPRAYQWIAIVGGIVFSTISTQDLPDVEGDAAKGRMTSPLVMGDIWSRWEVAIPIFLWSIFCPVFWDVVWFGYIAPLSVGIWLAFRILYFRTMVEDQISWRTWCLWTGTLYVLPLLAKK